MNPSIKNFCPQAVNFQLNCGQSDPEVKFLTQTNGYTLFMTPSVTVMVLKPPPALRVEGLKRCAAANSLQPLTDNQAQAAVAEFKLSGANANPEVHGLEELPGKVNYFIGNDPDKWLIDIPTYAKVKYLNVYPGIDITYSAGQQQIEWDFIVHPGANPELIALDIVGIRELQLDDQGNLLLTTGNEQIRLTKPVVYQEATLQRNPVSAGYTLNGRQVGFRIDGYDPAKPLVIDPVIEYSTYLGGKDIDLGYGLASDPAGNVYITGLTWSSWAGNPPGFPVQDPYQADNAGVYNVFITKMSAAGTLVYSTYLGGTDSDQGLSIAVDAGGNAYVTGSTFSTDFPTANPLQGSNNGNWDAFVTKLNANGNALIYSTYLGGTQDDFGYSIAVDPDGNAYVTGNTASFNAFPPGFPVKNPLQSDNNGDIDAFVTKISADGSSFIYSTYLGGAKEDKGSGVAADANGYAYVTGHTSSNTASLPGFPTKNPIQADNNGSFDAFITKIEPDGSGLIYSTYLGGSGYDEGNGIALDSAGNAYVIGYTASSNTSPPGFPTKNPLQPDNNGGIDVFVTKINADGNSLVYSTYLGGANEDKGYGIAVDANGYAYITGHTASNTGTPPGFPTKNPLQSDNNGSFDAFVTKIKRDGSGLVYSTYLGGQDYDEGRGITADPDGYITATGLTFSAGTASPPGFPVVDPLQANNNGAYDVFALRLAPVANLAITKSGSPDPLPLGQNLTYQITVTNNGPDTATSVILTDTLPPGVDFISASTGCGQTAGVVTCNLGILDSGTSAIITIIVKPKNAGTITNTATVTSTQSTPLSVTTTTTVITPVYYNFTNQTIKNDWRKNPPHCL